MNPPSPSLSLSLSLSFSVCLSVCLSVSLTFSLPSGVSVHTHNSPPKHIYKTTTHTPTHTHIYCLSLSIYIYCLYIEIKCNKTGKMTRLSDWSLFVDVSRANTLTNRPGDSCPIPIIRWTATHKESGQSYWLVATRRQQQLHQISDAKRRREIHQTNLPGETPSRRTSSPDSFVKQ